MVKKRADSKVHGTTGKSPLRKLAAENLQEIPP